MRVPLIYNIVTIIAFRAFYIPIVVLYRIRAYAQDASTIIFSYVTKHLIFIRRGCIIVYLSVAKFTLVLYQGCSDYYDNWGKAKQKKIIIKRMTFYEKYQTLFILKKKYLLHLLNYVITYTTYVNYMTTI